MRKPALSNRHWALVTDACGITTTSLFGLGVAMPHATSRAVLTIAAGAGIAGLIILTTVLALHGSAHLAVVIAGWTLLAVAWITYAHLTTDVWAWQAWRWLLIPAVVLTAATAIAYNKHLLTLSGQTRRQADDDRATELARWGDLLARCGFDGVVATSDSRAARSRAVTLTLPASGRVTLRTLQAATDNIAAAIRAKPGTVTFEQGIHAGEVILRVDTQATISQDMPYPEDTGPLTINDPIPIGVRPSAQLATVQASMSTLITGVTGSGKTNLLHVLIAQLTRCLDVIVLVIDLKGGRLAAPWILPWVEDRCPRPAIDWVATTRCEAALMLQAVDELITARGSTLAGGAGKARASRDLPQFVVICDEMADVTGDLPRGDWEGVPPRDLAERAAKVTRKARSEAVSLWWATQKGTIDFTGSSAVKSQCKQRLSLAAASVSDARSVTDSRAVVQLLAGAEWPGAVVIEAPGQRDAVLTKAWRLDADDDAALIDRLATAAGHTRPRPDAGALTVFGDRYADRWKRSGLYQLLLADFHQRTGRAPLPEPPAPQRPAPPDRAVGAVAALDVNQEAAALFSAAGLTGGKPDPEGRMWALLADRPAIGLSVIEIMWALDKDGLSVHRSTVYRWLARAEQDGKVRRSGDNGDATRWVLS